MHQRLKDLTLLRCRALWPMYPQSSQMGPCQYRPTDILSFLAVLYRLISSLSSL